MPVGNDHILITGIGVLETRDPGRRRPGRRPPCGSSGSVDDPGETHLMPTSSSTLVKLLSAPFKIAYRVLALAASVLFGLVKLLVTVALLAALAALALQAAGVGVDLGSPGGVDLPPALGGGAESAPGDPDVSTYQREGVAVNSTAVERLVHQEVNERRAERGLEPLEWNPTVASVSRAHSKDMADREYFAHTNPDGEGPFDRYQAVDSGCRAYGENIAMTWAGRRVETESGGVDRYESDEELAEGLVNQWMNSTGHRENMLRENWDSGGVGVYVTEDGQVFATHNFCRQWGL